MGKLRAIAGIFAVIVLLAGCGVMPAVVSAPPATPTATTAPSPTPVPTISSGEVSACFGSDVSPAQVTQIGDFLVSTVEVDGLAYPSVMLPDGTPTSKPYKLTTSGPQAYSADFPTSPVTNPALNEVGGGGFRVSLCNVAPARTHVLQGISAKITGFTAYSGQLNSWQACDSTMDSHHNETGGGCGGAFAGCMCFHAIFPNAGVGTTVAMTQTDASLINPGDNLGKLPLSLAPGKSITVRLGMDMPPPGTYTFSFGFTFDGVSPISTANSPTTLLAPVAHKWTGLACQQPAYEAQITPTNPESYYICAE